MPSQTSGYKLPWPQGTDRVMDGDDQIRKLAQSVENMIQQGQVTLDLTTADTNVTANVTFPTAFQANPTVMLTATAGPAAAGGASHSVWVTGVTPTGCTIGARRTQTLAQFVVRWLAVGPVNPVS